MLGNTFVFALVATALAAAAGSSSMNHGSITGDMNMLIKQKKIFDLFYYINSDLVDAEYYQIGRNYDIFNNVENYMNKVIH